MPAPVQSLLAFLWQWASCAFKGKNVFATAAKLAILLTPSFWAIQSDDYLTVFFPDRSPLFLRIGMSIWVAFGFVWVAVAFGAAWSLYHRSVIRIGDELIKDEIRH